MTCPVLISDLPNFFGANTVDNVLGLTQHLFALLLHTRTQEFELCARFKIVAGSYLNKIDDDISL